MQKVFDFTAQSFDERPGACQVKSDQIDDNIAAKGDYLRAECSVRLASLSIKLDLLNTVPRWAQLGIAVSPDDASLALRGMQTLGVRLERLEAGALTIAEWLQERPEVECVLRAALPGSPGHEFLARDFSGSASVFSFVFKANYSHQQVMDFVDRLQLFRQGFSWGGTTSLVMMYPGLCRPDRDYENRLVRLNIGLEEVHDLIVDLSNAMG